MKKSLLLLAFILFVTLGYSQTDKLWSVATKADKKTVAKTAQRVNFPTEFKLFELNLDSFRQVLKASPDRFSGAKGVLISLPNAEGNLERYEMFESSNFEPALQAQFPEIRSYVGIGVDDKSSQIRLSAAPNGIQAMFFRADRRDEFTEAYSADGSVYAVYVSKRDKAKLPFTCSTADVELLNDVTTTNKSTLSDNGSYKTMRLALSCTAEYANYFGANTTNLNASLVLTAMNNTMTRVNGICELDLAVHMNLIANEAALIYFDPASDPYSDASSMANWNSELQANLTSTVGDANYDIGHLFGASGGGGNAGCIGCVCVNGQKGSGITSPADGVPAGDNFDVDYVVHEMGHQMGARHTFTYGGAGTSGEDSTVNIEPGSGVTIMAYAGITNDNTSATPVTDVAPHSIPIFAYRSILQIQTNLATKTCPVSTPITNGLTISVPAASYTIPKGTAFILTGSGNAASYVWEQNDDATVSSTIETARAASLPSPTKTTGPNFRTFSPTVAPVRYMPTLANVIAGNLTPTTAWETVSTVARTLNFTLTGRNNAAVGSGQTKTATMAVSVSGTVGPFTVTSQSSVEAWNAGETKTITWNRNSAETLAGSTNVDILLSTDGGLTFPTTLASGVTNSGSAVVTVPSLPPSLTCRLMIKPTGNIYYAVNSTNFYIGYTITTTCNTYNYTTAFALPDNGSNYTIKTIAVPTTTLPVSDINVTANITHPNLQNLVVAVVKPGPTTTTSLATLFNQNCSGSANMNVTFDSQGTALTCASPTTGTYQPSTTLNNYNGIDPTGTWQFGFWDKVAGNSGTVNSFSIQICTQAVALTNNDFSFENFSLYPNPNKGSFNVKFNSNSNNDIQIAVYDMRGRAIFEKAYQNTGTFDQNVQLESIQSGIYLVNIQDGDKKVVKKIVIE